MFSQKEAEMFIIIMLIFKAFIACCIYTGKFKLFILSEHFFNFSLVCFSFFWVFLAKSKYVRLVKNTTAWEWGKIKIKR